MKKKTPYWFIFLLVICGIGMLIGYQQKTDLKKNSLVSSGFVTNVERSSKGRGVLVSYYFFVTDKKYESKSTILYSQPFSSNDFAFLLGKNLSVVYEKDNPKNSEMLFSRKEYGGYHISISQEYEPLINRIDNIIKRN